MTDTAQLGMGGPLVSPGQGGGGGSDFLEVNTIAGTVYEVVDSDNCKLLAFTAATLVTVTIPTGLTLGWHAMIAQIGLGQVLVVPAVGVAINEPDGNDRTAKQFAQMAINFYALELYLLGGYTAGP